MPANNCPKSPLRHFFILLLLCALAGPGQSQNFPAKAVRSREKALFPDSLKKAEVLLLGVFHFSYPGLDNHKTAGDMKVDVLSAARQKEIAELTQLLARFKPTKILVEYPADEQAGLDKSYAAYTSEKLKTTRNETTQIGFRLAKQLNHPRVFAIDADPFRFKLAPKDSAWMAAQENQPLSPAQEKLSARYTAYFKYLDTLAYRSNLKDHLLYMNSDEALRRSHSVYLVFTPRGTTAEPAGADGFITRWYNRNIRMFANVQRLAAKNDRILILVGAGHVPILKHLVENSPEFTLRRLDEFVK